MVAGQEQGAYRPWRGRDDHGVVLSARNQENGEQWTGLHQRMEELFSLAIGLQLAKWSMPRAMWDALPSGMPYVVIDLKPSETGLADSSTEARTGTSV